MLIKFDTETRVLEVEPGSVPSASAAHSFGPLAERVRDELPRVSVESSPYKDFSGILWYLRRGEHVFRRDGRIGGAIILTEIEDRSVFVRTHDRSIVSLTAEDVLANDWQVLL